jgi:uncharacterized membrane protein HdeD (DUF308 family)
MARALSADEKQVGQLISRLMVVKGVTTVLFGIFALIWPGLTLVTLGILLTLWLLVGGVTDLIASIMHRDKDGNWLLRLVLSLLQVGVGAYLVQRPGLSIATLVTLLAIVLIAQGVVDVVMSLVGKAGNNAALTVIGGLLGVVAGFIIWRYPVTGTLAFVWVLGLYSVIAGALWVVMGVDVGNETK